MGYFKKYGWIAGMAILVDFIAFKYWQSYLFSGSVHDGRHGITFLGEATYGHLIGVTLGAIVLTYYFIKTLVVTNREL
jgi:hypothetical protein